jgi:ParB family chromosome partitioning protein
MADTDSTLQQVDPDRIRPNPDNPRLVFREEDMNQLLASIGRVGIKVPLSIYRDGGGFVLIDGERRWRCSRRLNLKTVPAIVQPKPGKLENILTMFNIHNVRTDWDLMPMALKLADVRRMLDEEGQPTRPADLAGLTGVPLPTVRRALELLELPRKYQRLLLNEAKKPREQQSVTADLFVEVNKSKRVIERYVPEVFKEVSDAEYVDAMVDKYTSGVVRNVVSFRDVSRMARAERAGEDPEDVAPVIVKLVKRKNYRIEDAFQETVEAAYESRDLVSRASALIDRLGSVGSNRRLSRELQQTLERLRKEIDRLLRSA